MDNKFVSSQSGEILTHFNQRNVQCFSFSDAAKVLSGSSEGALRELLSDMVRRGLLMRLKRGLYYVIPYENALDQAIVDRLTYKDSIQGIVDDVITAYRTMVSDYNNLEIQRQNLQLTEETLKQYQLQYKYGKLSGRCRRN